jgi:diguanylate cyclase (GGDEF)-like protein
VSDHSPFLELENLEQGNCSLRMDCSGAALAVDEDGRIAWLNADAERLFECSAEEKIGHAVSDFIVGGLPRPSTGSARGGPLEAMGRRGAGLFAVGLTIARLAAGERVWRLVQAWDLSREKSRIVALEHDATHDALTGLPNRRLVRDQAEKFLAREAAVNGSLAVLMLQLGRLPEVHDVLGHSMGDQMLRRIVDRVQATLRATDVLGRMDGYEFVALLPGMQPADTLALASRLVEAVQAPFEVDGLRLQADLAIGAAVFPEQGKDVASLFQRAKVALANARRSRPPVEFYKQEHDHQSGRQLALTGELQRAVEEGHLELYYQPKIDGSNNWVAGVEALVRWNHPYQGLLFPDEFIPLAEQTGLIRPITRWVVEAALRQHALWESKGITLPVSVNCSARNLLEEDLPERIEALLKKYRVPPERLTLEITETTLIEDPQRAMDVTTLLDAKGVRISIDDFGTGYSSLDYLRRLPAKELKIDKSFVMKMDEKEGDAVLVRSIIDLAHNLGLKAVAEGVEGASVWRQLRSLGCDSGQGYFFAKPVPLESLAQWLQTSSWGMPTQLAALDPDAAEAGGGPGS